MSEPKVPVTSAVRVLRAANVAFVPHLYRYEERGGTRVSSRELGVDEHRVIKTLVLETDTRTNLVALMHGDREVSMKTLARLLGTKTVDACAPAAADRASGYQVGGTSPFGLRTPMPIWAEESIRSLPVLYINGGKRGFLVELAPAELDRVLKPNWASFAA